MPQSFSRAGLSKVRSTRLLRKRGTVASWPCRLRVRYQQPSSSLHRAEADVFSSPVRAAAWAAMDSAVTSSAVSKVKSPVSTARSCPSSTSCPEASRR